MSRPRAYVTVEFDEEDGYYEIELTVDGYELERTTTRNVFLKNDTVRKYQQMAEDFNSNTEYPKDDNVPKFDTAHLVADICSDLDKYALEHREEFFCMSFTTEIVGHRVYLDKNEFIVELVTNRGQRPSLVLAAIRQGGLHLYDSFELPLVSKIVKFYEITYLGVKEPEREPLPADITYPYYFTYKGEKFKIIKLGEFFDPLNQWSKVIHLETGLSTVYLYDLDDPRDWAEEICEHLAKKKMEKPV